jgi:hypothetical protein
VEEEACRTWARPKVWRPGAGDTAILSIERKLNLSLKGRTLVPPRRRSAFCENIRQVTE